MSKSLLNTLQIRNDYDHPPAGLKWRSNTFFITATVAIGLFTDLFLYGLIVPVLPFMLSDRVGVPDDQIQSHVSGLLATYAAASVLCSPFAGIVADRMSTRQAPFLLGLMALLIATLMFFLGTTVPVLVIARILQGISAGFVWTIGLALALETVGPENLGKTIGSIFSFISVGALVAPVLGGVLYEKAGYFSVCALGLAMIAVDLFMRVLVIEKKVADRYNAVNPAIASSNARDGRPEAGDAGDHAERDTADEENGEQQPLLGNKKNDDVPDDEADFKLHKVLTGPAKTFPILPCLKNPRLLTAFLLALVQAMVIGSFDATIPIMGRKFFGFDSLKSGVLLLPLGVADIVFGPLIGWCVDRFGTKPVAVAGFTYITPVLVLLRLPHAGGLHQILLYGGLLLLSGIGLASIGAPSIVEAGAVMERYHKANPEHFGETGPYAQLYGMSNMVFSLGLTVGPELAGEMTRAIGYGNMNLVLAVITFITACLSFAFIGPRPNVLRRARQTEVGSS